MISPILGGVRMRRKLVRGRWSPDPPTPATTSIFLTTPSLHVAPAIFINVSVFYFTVLQNDFKSIYDS